MDELLNIDNKPENFMDYWTNNLYKQYFNKKDQILKDALLKAGFDTMDHKYLKEHFQLIQIVGDKFEHLYYHYGKKDQQRIISMEKEYNIQYSDNEGTYKATMSQQYY